MTKHKTDDLFKQKLAGSEFAPSPAAWSKLESQLAHKKRKGIIFWMSTAASVALLLTFGWLIFISQNNIVTPDKIAQNNIPEIIDIAPSDSVRTQEAASTKDEIIVQENILKEEKEPNDQKQNKTDQSIKKQKTPKPSEPLIIIQQKSNLAINDTPETTQENVLIEKMENEVIITDVLVLNTSEVVTANTPNQQTSAPSKESGSIKLVYTLKPAISSESIAQETAEKTKNSPFKKVVAFAKNIKENPQGIGNLRNAKNSFLSLNKKKDESK